MNPRPQNTYGCLPMPGQYYTAPRAPAPPPFPGAPPGFSTPSHYNPFQSFDPAPYQSTRYNPFQSFNPAPYQSTQYNDYNPFQFQAPAVQTSPVQVRPTPKDPMEDPAFRDWIRKALVYFNVPFTDPDLPMPFTARLMAEKLPRLVNLPEFGKYSGDGDPRVHARNYKNLMDMVGAPDAYMCRYFQTTLAGPAADWFDSLLPESVDNWHQLRQQFCQHFFHLIPAEAINARLCC